MHLGNLSRVQLLDGSIQTIVDAYARTQLENKANKADAIPASSKGVANGIASLDSSGKVPSSQLPSYVDDVVEYATVSAFPLNGESGKIYVALDTNTTYRWSGNTYIEISSPISVATANETRAIISEYGVSG